MKLRSIAFLLFFIIVQVFFSCSQMPVKKNTYYTEREFLMIEKTTGALNMGFGFDARLDTNYFFEAGEGQFVDTAPAEIKKTKKGIKKAPDAVDITSQETALFAGAISEFSDKEQYYFYMKIYHLYSSHMHLKDYFKRNKMWRNYNLMRMELCPGIEHYMKVVEEYYKSQKPELYQDLVLQKEDIRKEAIMYNQKKYTIVDEYE